MTQPQSIPAPAEPSLTQSPTESPSLHVLLDVLANRRRRHLIQCLADAAEPLSIDEAGERVAEREGSTLLDVSERDVERATLSLSHTHVPKLVDAGVVEYTRKYDEIALAVDRSVVDPFLTTPTQTA